MIKDGRLHCHSEMSLKDSSLTIKEFVQIMSEQGARGCALTEHGNLLSFPDFVSECEKHGLKAIKGCELFVISDDDAEKIDKKEISTLTSANMSHLIVLGKNYEGEQRIDLAVTHSNKRVINKYKVDYPLLSESEVKDLFSGSNDVFATSACMGGVIGTCFMANIPIDKEIGKIREKIEKIEFSKELYLKNGNNGFSVEKELFEKKTEHKKLKKTLKKNPENGSKILTLETEIHELEKVNSVLSYELEIESLKARKVPLENMRKNAKEKLEYYQNVFGKENFFIELQYHYIKEEAFVMKEMCNLAQKNHVKVVCANDEHMARADERSYTRTALLRSIRFERYSPLREEDKHLYIKTDEELKTALLEIFPLEMVKEGMQNIGYIIDNCNAVRPKENYFPTYPIYNGMTVEEVFRQTCLKSLAEKGLDKDKVYVDRLNYEMETICKMGFADYLLIVMDYVDFGRKVGKLSTKNFEYLQENCRNMTAEEMIDFVNTYGVEVGFTVGTGRGSGAGSLACFCLGITTIDPIVYNLLFERFLNPSRVSMPDIDVDFSTEARDIVIAYVEKKYGEDRCCLIATKSTLASKGCIRKTGELLAKVDENQKKAYYNAVNKINAKIGEGTLAENKEKLLDMFARDSYSTQIINMASTLEGAVTHTSVHAGGVVISDNEPIRNHIPLMWNTEKQRWVCQCEKEQAEILGLLKMDFLGLKNLSIITKTVKKIKANKGIDVDVLNIPFEKEVFDEIFCKGKTYGVFQVESDGMMNMLRALKPQNIEDVILGIAIYRPGPMDSIPDIIAVKEGKKKPHYPIKEYADILDVTYGCPVYQEQLMQMFNAVGFSMAEADNVRKAMSKKKEELFMGYKDPYINALIKYGSSEKDAVKMWDDIVSFAKYAFNKSHSAVYGIVAYITAYLKYHYPAEYMSEVFNYLKTDEMDKIAVYVKDIESYNVNVLPPDINESEMEFTVDGTTIRYGLSNIKNVGKSVDVVIEERKNGGFKSLNDYINRCGYDKKIVDNLVLSGAFDSFGKNRVAMKEYMERYATIRGKLMDYDEELKKNTAMLNVVKDTTISDATKIQRLGELGSRVKKVPPISKHANKIEEIKDSISLVKETLDSLSIRDYETSEDNRLSDEKELLGAFITASPLDGYPLPQAIGCTTLDSLVVGNDVTVMGVISNLIIRHAKKNNKPMGFFNLEDVTNSIPICAFTECYDKYEKYIVDGKVIQLKGKVTEEVSPNDGSKTIKIFANEIKEIPKVMKPIVIHCKSMIDFTENIYPTIVSFYTKGEVLYPLYLHDEMMEECRRTTLMVNEEVLQKFAGFKIP